MKKCGESGDYSVTELTPDEYGVINELARFPEVVRSAGEKYEPSFVTRYSLDLATAFNKFYMNCKIATSDENLKNFRLKITEATKITLTNALTLLGIDTVEEM